MNPKEKGYKMHLWAYIRMFWNNAYYAIKGNIRKENIKGEKSEMLDRKWC